MSITSAKEINERLLEIWKDAANVGFEDKPHKDKPPLPFYCPVIFPDNFYPNECELLVVGLNPSYSYDGWKGILNEVDLAKYNYSEDIKDLVAIVKKLKKSKESKEVKKVKNDEYEKKLNAYFNFNNMLSNPDRIKEIPHIEKTSVDTHDYFKKMHLLAEHIFEINENPPWYHIDIYAYRKTSQNDLKKLKKKKEYSDFFHAQKELTKKIIFWLKPKMILVANAYAGEVFREMYYGTSDEFFNQECISPETGAYHIDMGFAERVHIFFSGMLSGQRALDLGSYERLKWHMKAVYEGKTMK